MKNKVLTFAALAVLSIAQTAFTGGQDNSKATIKKDDIQSISVVCGQGATGCQQVIVASGASATNVMGSAGDNESYNITGVNDTNLQRITENKTISLPVPAEGKKLYTLTPTAGASANKAAKVLFVVFSLDNIPSDLPEKVVKEAKEAKAADAKRHTAVKVYKQPNGKTQFTEILSYYTPEVGKFPNLKITLDKEGKFTIPKFWGADISGDLTSTE